MITSRWCPTCGSENLPDRNYCRECGGSLEFRCPACAFANRVGDRFCGGCGEPLLLVDGQPRPAWRTVGEGNGPAGLPPELSDHSEAVESDDILAAENRMATIVKADLSGFTAMSELLADPEEVTTIMNQVFDPLVACVRRYGGYIDNYAGDMIISFFGTPQMQEDCAERAVRAALEMRDEVARLNDRDISHGVELGISTGVATGQGLWGEVGFGAHSKTTLSGELGDYAAILEKYAERGTVGICPETYARVQHVIGGIEQDIKVHPPGDDAELPIYFAEPPRPRLRWIEAAATEALPWVGRDEAKEALHRWWAEAASGPGGMVHVFGEAGIGKTRLVFDLAEAVLARGHQVFAAAGRSLSEALGDDWQRDVRVEILRAAGVSPDDSEARAAWLNSVGLPPRSHEIEEWLPAVASQRPCLLILDGLDSLPGDLIGALHGLRHRQLLVVLVSRSPHALDAVRREQLAIESLPVGPLAPEALEELAESLHEGISPPQQKWLWRWSDGNPLYAREFARLLDQGVLIDQDGGPRVERLPWRIQELSDLAIDELDESDRAILLAASVAAESETLAVDPVVVGYLVGSRDWSGALQRLELAGLLRHDPESPTLYFRHRAVHHACRARLVDSVLRRLQDRVAQARELLAGT